jgi:hypothetical protein
MLRLLTPHYRVSSVRELTPGQLRQWGLTALLLDVDCTLARYRQEAAPEIVAWVTELRAAGIRLCLVSNGMGRRISRFAERLALPCVFKAMKPLPWGLRAGVRRLQSAAAETAMVGDQLLADILAGRLAGVRTILVTPIHPEDEPWFTRLKRGPEGLLLRRLKA